MPEQAAGDGCTGIWGSGAGVLQLALVGCPPGKRIYTGKRTYICANKIREGNCEIVFEVPTMQERFAFRDAAEQLY